LEVLQFWKLSNEAEPEEDLVMSKLFLETRTPGSKKNPDKHLTVESKATKIIHLFP